uniref:CCHC-type domain-containing protein n=1 Tax=Lepisosteus oculatus TaxID=7918 RepID=W5NLU7_LEPOC
AAQRDGKLENYKCVGLQSDNERMVILHMFDPFMPDCDVTTFLRRYVEVQEPPKLIIDRRRVWTGKRQYRVELRKDPRSPGGLAHPPATFAIGTGRGYLYYGNQPVFCRKCREYGHREADCKVTECRKCNKRGHETRHCPIKECSLCGATGHLYRDCRRRNADFN